MSFIPVQSHKWASKSTGVSFSLNGARGPLKAILSLTAAFQREHFGAAVAGRPIAVAHGRGDDEGLLRLTLTDKADGAILPRAAPHGAACLWLKPWDLLGTEAQASQACQVVDHDPNSVTLRLPGWASQKERKSRMAEFDLKPIARRGAE